MPYEKITYEKKDRIAYLTLNRPHVLNAWDHSMAQETEDALDAFDQDDGAWVLIISGFGRAFCSGGDVNMFKAQMEGRHPSGTGRRRDTILCELKNWKPVIAAVHGYAYGMGLIISAEADMIIAADNTQFAISELKRSLGGVGVWARVSQWMPSKVAAEMAITGDPITAQDAYRLGLVNRVVPLDQLMSEAEKMAERILSVPPLASRAAVQATRMAAEATVQETARRTPPPNLENTEDYREAMNSFVEKRTPVYTGR